MTWITPTQLKNSQIYISKNYNILIDIDLLKTNLDDKKNDNIEIMFKIIFGNSLTEIIVLSEIFVRNNIYNKHYKSTQLQTLQKQISQLITENNKLKLEIKDLMYNYWDLKHTKTK
jgi:cell division protein FtsB